MTLAKNRRLFQALIGAAILIVAVVLISITYSILTLNRESENKAQNKIVPPKKTQSLSSSVEDIKNKIIANPIKVNNGDLLIYEGTNFYIEYITTAKVFFVKISENAEASKVEAQQWFISKGFKQEDLCLINVRFVLNNFEIRGKNPNFSSLPDGCSGETLSR